MTIATAAHLRALFDLEAAALGAAAVLLGCPSPQLLAAARPRVAADGCSLEVTAAQPVAVPEFARALLRGWAGRPLLPEDWAQDVAATYLTLRLEDAQRHSRVRLLDPALPQLPPIAWHEYNDPGTAQLAWLARSASRRIEGSADSVEAFHGPPCATEPFPT